MSFDLPDEVLTAVSSTPFDHGILVGTSSGHIAQFDIRMTHKGTYTFLTSYTFARIILARGERIFPFF